MAISAVTIDAADVNLALSTFPRRLAAGTSRAINQTLVETQGFMTTAIADSTGLPPLYVGPLLGLKRASAGTLQGEVNATGKAAAKLIPVIQLQARQVGRGPNVPGGVTFRFAGVGKTLPNAFIATMRSGHRGVFSRTGKRRLPIVEEKGPSLRTIFGMNAEKGRAYADGRLGVHIARELDVVAEGGTPADV
jgi:hypothetical protein